MNESLILVPLDDSTAARAALPVAKTLGGIMSVNLHVLHVSHGLPLPLAQLASRLGLEETALHGWSIAARVGEPSATIIDEAKAKQVRLIVMCTHTTAIRPKEILGHTALDVLHDAPCPVVLVPPGLRAWKLNRILLPCDGSPTANATVEPAAKLARQAGAELLVIQVGAAGVATPIDCGSMAMPRYMDQPQHEWPSWTRELLQRLACLCKDELRATLHAMGGEPAIEIVRMAAEDPDALIVLAWKGSWIGEHAMTLKAVIRDAPCPVMIVQAHDASAVPSSSHQK